MENFNKETFLKYFYDIDKDRRYNKYDVEIIDVENKTATYFKSFIWTILIVFVLAIALLISSFSSSEYSLSVAFKVISVLLFIVGIILCVCAYNLKKGEADKILAIKRAKDSYFVEKNKNIPTDKEMDNFVENYYSREEFIKKVLAKLSIVEEEVNLIDPIIFYGYYFDYDDRLQKKGADGIWRCSSFEHTIIFFSEKQIYACVVIDNIKTGEHVERTYEYFYRDIVSITTDSKKISNLDHSGEDKNKDKDWVGNNEYIKLSTSGQDSLSIAFDSTNEDTIKSIDAMKHLLREKKI